MAALEERDDAGTETAARIAELEGALARGGPVPSRLMAKALLTLLRNQARVLGGGARVEVKEAPTVARDLAASTGGGTGKGAPGQERLASDADQARALERFSLEDLNRWLASGTVFQIREEFAYLNLDAMGGQVAPFRVNIRGMGFTRELGVLQNDAIRGRVLLFRKP